MNLFTEWKDKAEQFVSVRMNLAKLVFMERASNVLSFVVYIFILLFLAIATLIFLGISLQETFSHWFDSRIGGAFATLGFYVVLMLVAVGLRKPILEGFSSIFIRIMTANDDEDENPGGKKITVED